MRRAVSALIVGEPLLLAGLWLAWPPLALIAGGAQILTFGLLYDAKIEERRP